MVTSLRIYDDRVVTSAHSLDIVKLANSRRGSLGDLVHFCSFIFTDSQMDSPSGSLVVSYWKENHGCGWILRKTA